MELALTGDFISAARAYELGLINQVVEAGKSLEAAREMATKIAANGPLAVEVSMMVVAQAQDWHSDEAYDKQSVIIEPVFTSEDAMEGAICICRQANASMEGEIAPSFCPWMRSGLPRNWGPSQFAILG